MSKQHGTLNTRLRNFIGRQHMFFVATAPNASEGHLNLSPKGLDTFRILGPTAVAYLDLVGSGIETVAHLRENGRLVLLFCAFEGKPMIVRLHGRGRVVEPDEAEWGSLIALFPALPGARAVIALDVERISSSCGFGVPHFEYRGERSKLIDYAEGQGAEGMERYKAKHNRTSIDGLPGLRSKIPRGSRTEVDTRDRPDSTGASS